MFSRAYSRGAIVHLKREIGDPTAIAAFGLKSYLFQVFDLAGSGDYKAMQCCPAALELGACSHLLGVFHCAGARPSS